MAGLISRVFLLASSVGRWIVYRRGEIARVI